MKLIGSNRKGKHTAKGSAKAKPSPAQTAPPASSGAGKTRKKRMSGRKKAIIITCSILGLIFLLGGATAAVWRWQIQPFYSIMFPWPDGDKLTETPNTPRPSTSDANNSISEPVETPVPLEPNDQEEEPPAVRVRNDNIITFLVLGVDGYKGMRSEGGGNTDVVMFAAFDKEELTLKVVSVPRDTIVNVPWSTKKINSIWANTSNKHKGSANAERLTMEETKEHFANFLGFSVDFWVRVDMAAFESLVNSLPGGGVTVNVPSRVHLEDPDIKLNITLSPGVQKLNGLQALTLVRYRGYGDGDFGRINAQQIFLKALAEQILSGSGTFDLAKYAGILLQYSKTDMDLATVTGIGRELLNLKTDDITFISAPGESIAVRGIGGGSYVHIELDEWLDIVNNELSPFDEKITPDHVSILTLDESGRFYVTDGNWQGTTNWGRTY